MAMSGSTTSGEPRHISSRVDKRVLFLGIGFYDYEAEICRVLRGRGVEELCYVSTVQKDFLSRLLHRFRLNRLAQRRVARLRHATLRSTTTHNDTVFIIKGEGLTAQDIEYLKARNTKARFIVYLWDSLARIDNSELLLREFDNVWSFDRLDCQSDNRLKFRPSFYREAEVSQIEKEYDLSFIGWAHSDRLEILRTLRDMLRADGRVYFLKLYMGRFSYLIARYVSRRLKKSDRELITLRRLPYAECQRVTESSRAVLDISHPKQSGLTLRTFETLAAGTHLLTTNSDIANYLDIPASSYTIFDRAHPTLPITGDDEQLRVSLLPERYSIDSFIEELFNC